MPDSSHLQRKLGVTALAATGVCSMMGASIYIVPFMIQRHVPGIGAHVIWAFILAAIPAGLAALAYALLSSAMPRAGGSYVFGSRGLHPYWGFIASFSQWFGLSIAIGVIAYVITAFLADVFISLEWLAAQSLVMSHTWRPLLALLLLWSFAAVNLKGVSLYRQILIPMMIGMFILGFVVVYLGFTMDHQIFMDDPTYVLPTQELRWTTILSAAAILFASFIGFDSIAQAGGEARNPKRSLPRAIALAFLTVGGFYFVFTAAVYHAVPWPYIAEQALQGDTSAPALFSTKLPSSVTVLIIAGATLALINDLPAMLLAVSRLFFAWAKDALIPGQLAVLNHHHVPSAAIVISTLVASLSVLGCHFAGDFFLGVDILVSSMLLNFIIMCLTVLALRYRNSPHLSGMNEFIAPRWQKLAATLGIITLLLLFIFHIGRDLASVEEHWYDYASVIWIMVMLFGSIIYVWGIRNLKAKGVNIREHFSKLPDE